MCDPVTLGVASLAIGTAGAVSQYQAQKGQAKYAQQAATIQRNAEVATIRNQQVQEQQNEADRVEALRRQTEQKQATASAAAAEAGIKGFTVDSVLNELSGQAAEAETNLATNYARSSLGVSNALFNADQSYASTVANNPKPTGMGLGLQIGQAAVNAASTYYGAKGKT